VVLIPLQKIEYNKVGKIMKKIIGLNVNGVLCADGKTYWISDFNRKRLEQQGFENAYLSQVGGFNAVVYKCKR